MDTKWNDMDKDPGKNLESYVAAQVDRALNGAEDAPGVIRVTAKKHPRLRAWTGLFCSAAGLCPDSRQPVLCAAAMGHQQRRRVVEV